MGLPLLTLAEIAELPQYVKAAAQHDWLYPMFCLASHTGVRRSEMLRARRHDVDLKAGTVLIKEKNDPRAAARRD